MLVLTRRVGESIMIGGEGMPLITITVLKIVTELKNRERECLRIGITAPGEVFVHREEIYYRMLKENKLEENEQVHLERGIQEKKPED